jgi:hypothetical protein
MRENGFEFTARWCSLAGMAERSHILYASEPALDAAEFRRVLIESGLGETAHR